MQGITFDQVPAVLGQILQKLESIEKGITPKRSNEADQFLTVEQAAVFLALSKPTIYAYVSARKIPFMKKAHKLYFSRQDLTEWLRLGRGITKADADIMADQHLTKEGSR